MMGLYYIGGTLVAIFDMQIMHFFKLDRPRLGQRI